MTILSYIKEFTIAGLLILAAYFYMGKQGAEHKLGQATAEYSAALKASAEGRARSEAEARLKEQAIRNEFDLYKQETNEEISNVNARASALIERVRYYQSNQAGSTSGTNQTNSDTEAGQSTSGYVEPFVLGQIGREDVEEASRADHIRLKYIQCYDSYEFVRKQLVK